MLLMLFDHCEVSAARALIHSRDSDGNRPLKLAAEYFARPSSSVQIIVDSEAFGWCDACVWAALHSAGIRSQSGIVRYLLGKMRNKDEVLTAATTLFNSQNSLALCQFLRLQGLDNRECHI
jgi:hypothetical protein